MSETKHTPGPWTLETVQTSVGVCHKIGPLGNSTRLHSACLYDDCYSDRARDLQLLADASLIAAAPELLEALKAATEEIDWMCANSTLRISAVKERPAFQQIKAAIAKAEGRQ